MEFIVCPDYETFSSKAASLIVERLRNYDRPVCCLASGSSPTGAYEKLPLYAKTGGLRTDTLTIVKLDEWYPLALAHPASCEAYMRTKIIRPLGIPENRYISLNGKTPDVEKECQRVQAALDKEGGIDLCVLGLGINGHLGFNEPGDYAEPFVHLHELTPSSTQHAMIRGVPVEAGLTLGMANLLSAKEILLLVSGENKQDIFHRFRDRHISPHLPVSFLWLHRNVRCIVDQSIEKEE